MKTSLLLVVLSILLLLSFFALVDGDECSGYRGKTITTSLHSYYIKDYFKIVVYLPKSYEDLPDRRYPVIYQLNGNYHGRMTAILTSHLHCRGDIPTEAIVVAVGYDFDSWFDKRERDYIYVAPVNTETQQTWERDAVGGGLNFYRFLRDELIPYVDENFRTDNETYGRTLAGHSLAGYFTLFALFKSHLLEKSTPPFKNFIAAAPMVVNKWFYLASLERSAFLRYCQFPQVSLYMAMSEEDESNPFQSFLWLSRRLKRRPYPTFRFKSQTFKDFKHVETAVPGFQEGLKFIFVSGGYVVCSLH
jgi:hypothetical protein